jgi:hypothetical protein
MIVIIRILQKVIVNYFYDIHAGLFLFFFFVLFGLPNAPLPFHVSIINGIVQSRLFLFIVIGVWALYNLKCIVYTLKQLEQSKQNFLHWLNALPADRPED